MSKLMTLERAASAAIRVGLVSEVSSAISAITSHDQPVPPSAIIADDLSADAVGIQARHAGR
jgi:hypothetical protein